jgi:SagB-type dehydrogenase family enzyme
MMRTALRFLLVAALLTVALSDRAQTPAAPGLATIALPSPKLDKGMPLMQSLKKRHTTRAFADRALSLLQLSELLWAADGVNRTYAPGENPGGRLGTRTAPSAMDRYPIDIYVVLPEGIYRFEPAKHDLAPVVAGDFRKLTGSQAFVAAAPVNLVYVADYARFTDPQRPSNATPEMKLKWSAIEAGCITQNVYLYCASEGLGTVVRTTISEADFAKAAGLRADQVVIAAQTVGVVK